jgi:chromosome segregation ATPase
VQAAAQVRRRLAALELEVDRSQGWVRGGTKADARASAQQRERLREQEAQIRALRQQLEFMQAAASRAQAAAPGRARALDGDVPAEYICPITQV